MRRRAAIVVLCAGVVIVAACVPSPSSTPTGSASPVGASPSGPISGSVTVVRLASAEPAFREEAAIEAAFDPAAAADLAELGGGDVDWATYGVLCVYLGRRTDGGWGLTIQSASLLDGELVVLARETRPTPGVDRPGPTFPGDCATIDRSTLPAGALPARAHDTISDEFIVAGVLQVPAR